jgi:hypothetical protein
VVAATIAAVVAAVVAAMITLRFVPPVIVKAALVLPALDRVGALVPAEVAIRARRRQVTVIAPVHGMDVMVVAHRMPDRGADDERQSLVAGAGAGRKRRGQTGHEDARAEDGGCLDHVCLLVSSGTR